MSLGIDTPRGTRRSGKRRAGGALDEGTHVREVVFGGEEMHALTRVQPHTLVALGHLHQLGEHPRAVPPREPALRARRRRVVVAERSARRRHHTRRGTAGDDGDSFDGAAAVTFDRGTDASDEGCGRPRRGGVAAPPRRA